MKPTPTEPEIWTESRVLDVLASSYAPPAWAFLPKVRNGTGFAKRQVRTADALAMSLYPSRGLDIYGFEIKVSRSDFKAELTDPEKAEEMASFCDYWFIVAPKGLIEPGDLPPAWGLTEVTGRGIRTRKTASKLTPKPLGRIEIAAMMRSATVGMIPKSTVDDAVHRKVKEEKERWRDGLQTDVECAQKELAHWKEAIAEFEKRSGLSINKWDSGRIGEGVKEFMAFANKHNGTVMDLEELANRLVDIREALLQAAVLAKKVREKPAADPVPAVQEEEGQ